MSETPQSKADAFAALHAGPDIFVMPNPWDIGSTQILTGMGFKALATTSAGYAFSRGRMDGVIGRDEMLAHVTEIVDATDLPVTADLENGYGDSPEAAGETIRLATLTGLAGGSIEDYTPHDGGKIYDMSLATDRVAAAAAAARASEVPFILTARAENFIRGNRDLDDTIKRLQAFEAAGADVLYAPGLPGLDAIRTVCQSVGKPVNLVMGLSGSDLTTGQLADAGVRRISLGGALARAALGAFMDAAKEIQTGNYKFLDRAATFPEIAPFMRANEN
ncbi:MAG: isocitrate lyase/phosphoenolpyruvate mutase family protein [Rhodospirillaceae bacterium]|jgi:2-methylisocitrate lyase-like PEP mutase family enzyme|nr:isocitrate lyase/phosphoenolpyruvate mutase family protein [Rhodospirillaceae bacterium]MBT5899302.1 isocitrate lyase/phosphoenolpyruvate mutase family protein [Rhodospirillaceae bacterium]MBT6429083.1 isocitrate lyase/phosphoenolpyruvate mutase family protein [Rhodospirillaceae bacterium]